MTDPRDRLEALIARAGSGASAARVLGLAGGNYLSRIRTGRLPIQAYHAASIDAHLRLSDRAFAEIMRERGRTAG